MLISILPSDLNKHVLLAKHANDVFEEKVIYYVLYVFSVL